MRIGAVEQEQATFPSAVVITVFPFFPNNLPSLQHLEPYRLLPPLGDGTRLKSSATLSQQAFNPSVIRCH